MKKIISIFICAVMLFSFAACGRGDDSSDTAAVDIEYFAGLGEIPDCPYRLGKNIDELQNTLSAEEKAAVEAGEEYVYLVTEGEKTVQINNGAYLYYYEKDKKENGVSYIAALNSAYGFENGASVLEVKEALSGFEYTEEDADSDNVFFILGFSGGSVLKYTFDNIVIMFVFEDNMLCAAAIYDTDNWTL